MIVFLSVMARRRRVRRPQPSVLRIRIRPSWTTEATRVPSSVNISPRMKPRAPEALLKLGLSLQKLGARDQACAAYGEIGRKYTSASASIRASADRESKRSQC